MLPEWLKSIFRGTRKEVKETVNENIDAVAQKAATLTKAAIAKEAEIIKTAIPMANSIVDTVDTRIYDIYCCNVRSVNTISRS